MNQSWLATMRMCVPDFDKRRVFVFDMDGTLTGTLSGKMCANDPDDPFPLPNTYKYLQELRKRGFKIVIWTNQGGVAHGFMPEKMGWRILLAVEDMYGGCDLIKVNFYHDSGKFKEIHPNKAKPSPALLNEVFMELEVTAADCIAVGNAHTDQKAAEYAQVPFVWAHTFFGWKDEVMVQDHHGYMIKPELQDALRAEVLKGR